MKKIVFICDKCKEDITEWEGNLKVYIGKYTVPGSGLEFDLCSACAGKVQKYIEGNRSVTEYLPAVCLDGADYK